MNEFDNASTTGWKLQPVGVQSGAQLFGLVYPGNGYFTWAYLTLGQDAAVLSQPRDGGTGTSLTNSWTASFIKQLRQLAELSETVSFYEHYYGEEPTLDQVKLSGSGNLKWQHIAHSPGEVAEAFSEIVGEPIPDFVALPWGESMSTDAARERWQALRRKREEENIAYAARCRKCGKMIVVPAQATPVEMHLLIHGDEPCRPKEE